MFKRNIDQIARFLAQTEEPKQIKKFLEEILTPAEMRDLASRWEIVRLLKQGMSQRKIAKTLHVSLCKITRGSKELKKARSLLRKAVSEKID